VGRLDAQPRHTKDGNGRAVTRSGGADITQTSLRKTLKQDPCSIMPESGCTDVAK